MKHFAHVSIRELTSVSTAGNQEIKHDLDAAGNMGMGIVQIRPGGLRVPAAVTLRTVVNQQVPVGDRIRDNWHVVIAPVDSENLRRRLFAERNATRVGALDVPIPQMAEASYDAVKALDKAHEGLSKLAPPREGTYVEMTLAITSRMGRVITFRPSSVEVLRRARGWAKHHNERAQARWSAAHFPANGPVIVGGLRVWPWWHIDEPDFEVEPEIPEVDAWEPGGDVYDKVGDVVAEGFLPIMESLWKAAFAQDPFVAGQLRDQGFNLDNIEATRLGIGPLRDLMSRFRKGSAHMTMMAPPDLIKDLGDDAIRKLTHQ